MAFLDELPALHELFLSLQAQRDAADAELAPLRAEYDALQAQISPLLDKQRAIGASTKAIIATRKLGEVQNQMAAIARAAGGRSTSQAL